jgi:hypothetical protein
VESQEVTGTPIITNIIANSVNFTEGPDSSVISDIVRFTRVDVMFQSDTNDTSGLPAYSPQPGDLVTSISGESGSVVVRFRSDAVEEGGTSDTIELVLVEPRGETILRSLLIPENANEGSGIPFPVPRVAVDFKEDGFISDRLIIDPVSIDVFSDLEQPLQFSGGPIVSGETGPVYMVSAESDSDIPEPGSFILMCVALTGLGICEWRSKRAPTPRLLGL